MSSGLLARLRRWLTGQPQSLARRGELLARRHLERNGYRILAAGWRWKRFELDLVARRDNTVAFIEVKTRTDLSHGHPQEAVGRHKQRHIVTTAKAFVAARKLHHCIIRYDIVAILIPPGEEPQITHIENAFQG